MGKLIIASLIVFLLVGFFFWQRQKAVNFINPSSDVQQKELPLSKYTFDSLSKGDFAPSEITLGEILTDDADFTSYKFYFWAENKKVSGLLNVPKSAGSYPVIVMFRGYVDKEIFAAGVGTQRAGEVFAKNGFITLAPDFLGYGESDNPSANSIEERFQTYATVLTLLESVKNLNKTFSVNNISARTLDGKVGIWGHSNGGQIALSILEISGKSYPAVLWAPVSKPFPYSVLYYTDEFEDRGKLLRRAIADFEKDYDIELYNLTNYFARIAAPLQIHQGTADDSVPQKWSDQLVEELNKLEKDVEYFTYSGADHNLLPGWDLAVSRSIEFYRKNLPTATRETFCRRAGKLSCLGN